MERYEMDGLKMVKFKHGSWVHWADVRELYEILKEVHEQHGYSLAMDGRIKAVLDVVEEWWNNMDWIEFQEGLFEEGYERRPYNSVDGRVIRKALCPDCGKTTLFPKAFTNSNNEYVLYQACSWCDYYGEV